MEPEDTWQGRVTVKLMVVRGGDVLLPTVRRTKHLFFGVGEEAGSKRTLNHAF